MTETARLAANLQRQLELWCVINSKMVFTFVYVFHILSVHQESVSRGPWTRGIECRYTIPFVWSENRNGESDNQKYEKGAAERLYEIITFLHLLQASLFGSISPRLLSERISPLKNVNSSPL